MTAINESEHSNQREHYMFPCEVIVWRIIKKKSFWDAETGELLPDAYFRRPPTVETPGDTDGLSVSTKDHGDLASFEEAAHLTKTGGIVTLHTGRVSSLGLSIVSDKPDHANINGIPFYFEGDKNAERKAKVERLAGQLVTMSRPNKKVK